MTVHYYYYLKIDGHPPMEYAAYHILYQAPRYSFRNITYSFGRNANISFVTINKYINK